jgi:hypothetical protein
VRRADPLFIGGTEPTCLLDNEELAVRTRPQDLGAI